MPTVVFDVGNVLIRWDPFRVYREMIPDDEKRAWFLQNVCTAAWNIEQDRGRSWEEGVALLVASHPEWESQIRAYDERWHEAVPGMIEDSVSVLEELKGRGDKVYAITNFSREKWAECLVRFPFLQSFDGVIVSAHERVIKPDPAIYRILLDRYGLVPADCIFVDDSARNIETARSLGMQGVHFVEPIDLRAELARHGVAF
ncbi:HAD family phosphatase [Bosea sp. (in: a-proteobacteria)]|jgi:2-haloacid dehalogenase|uniref:HAD family hydrolase n=1 Tax=Bosea sp. (in: a-proteobacteria) TaxID=1871050 RepID=UPI002B4853F5|nr:HAD family phosphatase [Bosea sp. (in: a-proteobacteria)]WRH57184.1 MAG: HAD family phosphatase [Bosea sp. (in: a-proteobacteria)]